ncbi:MAG: LemA family protein [Sphingomonadaceae bacterium]
MFMTLPRHFALLAPIAAISLAGCGINTVPTQEENAKAKWANVQADYQRRADLIPNLVETVKGFARQESTVLTQVTEARARATQTVLSPEDLTDPAKVKAFQDAQGAVTSALISMRNITEAYPQLSSNANFLALQSQLEGTENRINVSVKDYNAAVQAYNTTIRTFPDAIGAKIFYGAKPMAPYQATAPNADRAPTVKF